MDFGSCLIASCVSGCKQLLQPQLKVVGVQHFNAETLKQEVTAHNGRLVYIVFSQ